MKINILGAQVDSIDSQIFFNTLKKCINAKKRIFISSINPEILLKALNNPAFLTTINSANFVIADGIGLKYASLFLHGKNLYRLTGVDILNFLLTLADEQSKRIVVILPRKCLSSQIEIQQYIKNNYPKIELFVIISGNVLDNQTLNIITEFNPNIILLSLGAPWQEMWIRDCNNSRKIKYDIAVGIGGAFDFLTQKTQRAPYFMRKAGFEWLWRLFLEPRYRFNRVINATMVFTYCVIVYKIKSLRKPK